MVLGTDYPYDMGEEDPLGLIAQSQAPAQGRAALIAGGSTARLLKIKF